MLPQGVGLVALNLELDIPLDTIFADGGISNAVDAFANAVAELDVRKSHCASRMDFAYLISQVSSTKSWPGVSTQETMSEQCNLAILSEASHACSCVSSIVKGLLLLLLLLPLL